MPGFAKTGFAKTGFARLGFPAARWLFALAAAACLFAAPARADSLWSHNGSVVRLVADGAARLFYYEEPRPRMAAAGVRPGTLLFRGRRVGDAYEGVAHVFSRDCERPGAFAVRGRVVGETYIRLAGARGPLVDCVVTPGARRDELIFTFLRDADSRAAPRPAQSASPPAQRAPTPAVAPPAPVASAPVQIAPPPAVAPPMPVASAPATPPPAVQQQALPPPAPASAPPAVAQAPGEGRRVALVIGNAGYRNVPMLRNPPADADLLAATLRASGFASVTVKTDLTREGMIQSLQDFATVADSADWAMIYFSGHGVEIGGSNYIIPVDARLRADRDAELETISATQLLGAIEGARKLRLVVLDACRDNPFASQMRRVSGTRSVGRGLARIEPDVGTLVVYAAKHGETALDGDGANSPFASAMARRIGQTPPVELRRLFDLVRDDVLAATGRKQQPFSYGSIPGSEDFYFAR